MPTIKLIKKLECKFDNTVKKIKLVYIDMIIRCVGYICLYLGFYFIFYFLEYIPFEKIWQRRLCDVAILKIKKNENATLNVGLFFWHIKFDTLPFFKIKLKCCQICMDKIQKT